MGKVGVVLPAGGSGKRIGGPLPKQLLEIGGIPVWLHALRAFSLNPLISEVALVCPADRFACFEAELAREAEREPSACPVRLAVGGAERWISVRNGVRALSPGIGHVLVHDVARPFVSAAIVRACVAAAERGESFVVAKPCVDTAKRVDGTGTVLETVDRSSLWLAQTPQGFPRAALESWYAELEGGSAPAGFVPTDEASIAERFGAEVRVVEGDAYNDKITLPGDLERFEAFWNAGLLQNRTEEKA